MRKITWLAQGSRIVESRNKFILTPWKFEIQTMISLNLVCLARFYIPSLSRSGLTEMTEIVDEVKTAFWKHEAEIRKPERLVWNTIRRILLETWSSKRNIPRKLAHLIFYAWVKYILVTFCWASSASAFCAVWEGRVGPISISVSVVWLQPTHLLLWNDSMSYIKIEIGPWYGTSCRN